ncbi:hypothetical protein P2318_31775 [Myxococcaceae bacterium GXIMD 01537]
MTSPTTPPPRGGPPKGVLIGLAVAGLGAVVVGAFVLGRRSAGTDEGPRVEQPTGGTVSASTSSGPAATVEGLPPPPAQPVKLEVPSEKSPPALWVDVHSPGKVRQALVENAWLREQMQRPLGQGFAGGWAAFLGSSGEDLKADFQGAVFNVVAGKLLNAPFRAVWFSGNERAGTPALVVPRPGAAASAAYDAMDKVARRSEAVAERCPGAESGPEGGLKLARWLVAEQPLWAARGADRLVVGRHPAVVLQGLCMDAVKLSAPEGVDVEVGFAAEPLGREMQLLQHVLGLGPDARLQFAVQGTRLVGRGIAGALAGEARLDAAPLSDALLKLVPEETPVLLALQLKLPEQLSAGALKEYWATQRYKGATRTRQVALAWTPRGDAALPQEVALLWGRTEDAAALRDIFRGNNTLTRADLCGHHVLASSDEVLGRLRKACEGKLPNMLNAAGPVVEGLRAPASVAFGVNTGRLLGLLTADGYFSEQQVDAKKPLPRVAPKEIEAARRDLEALPYVGLRGTVQGDSLVPGGFGS